MDSDMVAKKFLFGRSQWIQKTNDPAYWIKLATPILHSDRLNLTRLEFQIKKYNEEKIHARIFINLPFDGTPALFSMWIK
jgi:hypothetical protein